MVHFVGYSRTDAIVIRIVLKPKIYFVTAHLVYMTELLKHYWFNRNLYTHCCVVVVSGLNVC